jgi:hypothetical protein
LGDFQGAHPAAKNNLIGRLYEIQSFPETQARLPNAVEQIQITVDGETMTADAIGSYLGVDGRTHMVIIEYKSSASAPISGRQSAVFGALKKPHWRNRRGRQRCLHWRCASPCGRGGVCCSSWPTSPQVCLPIEDGRLFHEK